MMMTTKNGLAERIVPVATILLRPTQAIRLDASNIISLSSPETQRFHSPSPLLMAGPKISAGAKPSSIGAARQMSPWPGPPSRADANYSAPDDVTTGEYSAASELTDRCSNPPSSIKLYRQISASSSLSVSFTGRSETKYNHRPSGET